jgi:hypothetical protein
MSATLCEACQKGIPGKHCACTWAHAHSACRHVHKLFETHVHYFLVHIAMPSFSPSRLSSASWPTTSLSAKCQRAASALSSPKPSTASTSGAIGRASMAFESCCASQPSCCACTPLHVLASATGQLYTKLRSKMAVEPARKLIYVHSNGKESGKEREDLDLCLNLLEEEA